MSCIDWEILSRYQDGSLSEEESRRIDEHVTACASCREKLRTLGHAGLFFRMTIGSHKSVECPTEEELGAYLSGLMREEDRARVETHLNSCRRCLHEAAVMSDDGALTPADASPAPSDLAIERFRRLAPRPAAKHPRFAFAATWGLRAAAAALIAAVVFGHIGSPAKVDSRLAVAPADLYLAQISPASTDNLIPNNNADLAMFARDVGLVLREVERVHERPRADSLEMVQEDIRDGGLLARIDALIDAVREARNRQFLADCREVLTQIDQADRIETQSPSSHVEQIVSDIHRLDLIETARLVEMEGGRSQWLAGL